MFTLFSRILDRIIFTISFIIGVQAPEFIQQYVQRLSGHLNEAKHQLQQFQHIADLQFNGDLEQLITRYQQNTDISIVQTGDIVLATQERINHFEGHLSQLQQNDYLSRVYHFLFNSNLQMAKETLSAFNLAIPLEVSALVTGIVFAFSILLMQTLLITGCKSGYKKLTTRTKQKLKPLINKSQ